jgi:hypothetical protein
MDGVNEQGDGQKDIKDTVEIKYILQTKLVHILYIYCTNYLLRFIYI